MMEPDAMLQTLIEELPPAIFEMPLECIFADNFRCRALCSVLYRIAAGKDVELTTLGVTLHFLRFDFANHVADEEQALFQLLRERMLVSDGLEQFLTELRSQPDLTGQVVNGLEGLQESRKGRCPPLGLRELLESFVKAERRRISVENVVLLPVARQRLSQSDLALLGRAMRSRRLSSPAHAN